MRIEKCEKIYLSEEEQEIFNKFIDILDAIKKESENSDIIVAINDINEGIFDLVNYIEE